MTKFNCSRAIYCFLVTLLFLHSPAWSNPFPAPDRHWDQFLAGFEMDLSKNNWMHTRPQEYSLPEGRGEMSWRILNDSGEGLATQVQDWKKQFAQLGFRIDSSQLEPNSVVFELTHPMHKKKLRQVILKENHQIVLLTCTAPREDFPSTLAQCTNAWQSFRWLKGNQQNAMPRVFAVESPIKPKQETSALSRSLHHLAPISAARVSKPTQTSSAQDTVPSPSQNK